MEGLLPKFLLKHFFKIYLEQVLQIFNILLQNHLKLYLFCFLSSSNNIFKISFSFFLFLFSIFVLLNIPILLSSLLPLMILKKMNWVIIFHVIVFLTLILYLSSWCQSLQTLIFYHHLFHFAPLSSFFSIFCNLIFLLSRMVFHFEISLCPYFQYLILIRLLLKCLSFSSLFLDFFSFNFILCFKI